MERDYIDLLKKITKQNIPAKEYIVFLFGSRAKNAHHDRSDIDIGIWGAKSLDPLVRANLEYTIENSIIPHFVDIVDFSKAGKTFKKQALKHIELWNCPKDLKPLLKA